VFPLTQYRYSTALHGREPMIGRHAVPGACAPDAGSKRAISGGTEESGWVRQGSENGGWGGYLTVPFDSVVK
jgi:hypothetical protein